MFAFHNFLFDYYNELQIGPVPGDIQAGVYNVDCKDVELIANGLCTDGWYYYDGTEWRADTTVVINCIGNVFSCDFEEEVPRV